MEEAVFIPTPNWFLPTILSTRKDGSVSYGSNNKVVILKINLEMQYDTKIIKNAHSLRVTSVAFSPPNCDESLQNSVASCSEDGFVKLWNVNTLTLLKGHNSHWEQKENMQEVVNIDWSIANPHYIISAASNSTLVLWDVFSNTTVKFSFPRLIFTIVKCCPFNEKVIAAGVKSGLVYIISLKNNGNIIHSLRGHDTEIQSLSWCPAPFNIFKFNEICEEFLLASASQNKEIFIWRAGSNGKCEEKIIIPRHSISKENECQKYGKTEKNTPFTAVYWHDAYTIYFSNSYGELVHFNIKSLIDIRSSEGSTLKIKQQKSDHFILGHNLHSKKLFVIAGVPQFGEIILHENLILKSALKFKVESNIYNITTSEGNSTEKIKWSINVEKSSLMLWTTGQDRKLIGSKFSDIMLDVTFNIPTLNGCVYCAELSPHDPNKLAIGAGDGVIRLWNLTQASSEVEIYWEKIKDRVMSLAWHPAKEGLLAYGTSKGRVGLVDTNSNKPPLLFKSTHSNSTYSLSWGPQFLRESEKECSKKEFDLYAIGNNMLVAYSYSHSKTEESTILTDLPSFPLGKVTDVCWKPDFSLMLVGNEIGMIYFIEPSQFKVIHKLHSYKKLIYSIAWHPPSTSVDTDLSPYHSYFTAGSTDNSNLIHVYEAITVENGVNVELVASLKGHKGQVQSISWSPYVGGRLISSSSDYSVIIWDVISQSILTHFISTEMPMFSLWSPIDSDLVLTGYFNSILLLWKVSTQSSSPLQLPAKSKMQKKSKKTQMDLAKVSEENIQDKKVYLEERSKNEIENVAVAEEKNLGKFVRELKMFPNAWKSGALNSEFETCYALLKKEENENDYKFLLPFLGNENNFNDFINAEEGIHKRSNNWNEYYELAVWSGKIKSVLEEKIKDGRLNDFLVSLAPFISPRLWQEACLSYSKTLTEKKQIRKAATYLLICHKIYDAINLLTSEKLYLEALCIARSRLPESDPMISSIVQQYAQWLFKNGSFLKAAECYIFLKDYSEVAKICRIKNKPEYLSLASLASRRCGDEELEYLEATNALLKCFEINNFELANRICEDHNNLRHLRLLYKMYSTIFQLDTNVDLVLEEDILIHIKKSLEIDEIKLPFPLQQLYQKYVFYKNKCEMYIVVAQELSLAVLANSTSEVLTHLIRALSTSYRYIHSAENEIHPLFKLCSWLSPGLSSPGFLSDNSYFHFKESELSPKIRSLREFLCAAIIKNLNEISNEETFQKWVFILRELKENILHEESYAYFKNLLAVEICEKRLLSSLTNTHISSESISKEQNYTVLNGHSDELLNKENCEPNLETQEVQNNVDKYEDKFESLGKKILEIKIKDEEEDFEQSRSEFKKKSLTSEALQVAKENELKEQVNRDKELLIKLKREIKDFETERISSPNPVPVYFLAKQLFEKFKESEIANVLLEDLQNKWQKLQS